MGESEFFAQGAGAYRALEIGGPPRRLGDLHGRELVVLQPALEMQPAVSILDDARSRITLGGLLILASTFYAVTVV